MGQIPRFTERILVQTVLRFSVLHLTPTLLWVISHTRAISKSCFYHLRSFRRIRSPTDHSMAISVASTLVSSRFENHIARLQRAQHALARVVTQQSSRSCPLTSTDLLRQLHWLPIEWRTKFTLASLTYKALHIGHPPYLAELLQYHKLARSAHSSASHSLSVPRHNLSFDSGAFRISAPKIRNSLPPHSLQS